jgi:hypothetical protein
MELEPGMAHMELRQLRYVVTLVEKLHFGWAFLIGARQILREVQERYPELLVPEGDRLAASPEVPVAKLAAQLAASRGSCRGGVGAA